MAKLMVKLLEPKSRRFAFILMGALLGFSTMLLIRKSVSGHTNDVMFVAVFIAAFLVSWKRHSFSEACRYYLPLVAGGIGFVMFFEYVIPQPPTFASIFASIISSFLLTFLLVAILIRVLRFERSSSKREGKA